MNFFKGKSSEGETAGDAGGGLLGKVGAKAADKVSLSRVVGGHHYPSDIKYGEMLGKWLSGQLKK